MFQWVECGWAEIGWVEGDNVCPPFPVPTTETRTYQPGGGTGFQRQSKISLVKGTRSYIEPYRRDKQTVRMEKGIIEFIVRFTTEYL